MVVALLPLGSLYYITYDNSRVALEKSAGIKSQAMATQSMEELFVMIKEVRRDLILWSSHSALQQINTRQGKEKAAHFLNQIKDSVSPHWVISVIQPGGNILASSQQSLTHVNVGREPWYQNGSLVRDFMVQDLSFFGRTGGLNLTFSIPIYRDHNPNQIIGHLFLQLSWKGLIKMINAIKIDGEPQNKTQYALLINKKGKIIAAPEFILKFKTNQNFLKEWDYKFPIQNYRAAQLAQLENRGYQIETGPFGNEYLIGFAGSKLKGTLDSLNWSLLILQDTESAFAAKENLMMQFVLMGLLVLGIIIVLVTVIFKQIKNTFKSFTQHSEEIS